MLIVPLIGHDPFWFGDSLNDSHRSRMKVFREMPKNPNGAPQKTRSILGEMVGTWLALASVGSRS
jgi:hypothetical protein